MRQFITKILNIAVLCMHPIRGSSLLVLSTSPFQYRISGASLLPPLNHRTFLLSTTIPSLSQYRSFLPFMHRSCLHPQARDSFLPHDCPESSMTLGRRRILLRGKVHRSNKEARAKILVVPNGTLVLSTTLRKQKGKESKVKSNTDSFVWAARDI
jgi:hypothetical protein